jgi:hypothetical protein
LLDRPVIAIRDHRSNIHGHFPFHSDVKGELLPVVLWCHISFYYFSLRGAAQKSQVFVCARRTSAIRIKAAETRSPLRDHGKIPTWEKNLTDRKQK